MEHADAEKHGRECFEIRATSDVDKGATNGIRQRPDDFWGKDVAAVVQRRAKEVAKYQEWVM
jgi:hypothetical protein